MGYRLSLPWPLAVLLVALAAGGGCVAPAPDLMLTGGRVFTSHPDRPWAEALAIRGDRIVAVGTDEEVSALAGTGTIRRDLGGRVVVAGFNDAHVDALGTTPADIRQRAAEALAAGVTSLHWFVGDATVRERGEALVAAGIPIRVRMLRMPRPGPDGRTVDSRPHLPPQPSLRVDIRGMGFRLGAADEARIRQAVGWAYGTEDLLAIEALDAQALAAYLDALSGIGIPDVWRRKRPRLEQAPPAATAAAASLAERGVVVVQRPEGQALPLASWTRAGVALALGTGRGLRPAAAMAAAIAPSAGDERLTVEQAVVAMTRGGAHAELADRDKGHLSVGALADLAVLSVDPFAAPAELPAARSVLTIVGGRVVHDVP